MTISKYSFLFSSLLSVGLAGAQTKMIAHKSHSGSKETVTMALRNSVFNLGNSNFGQAPSPEVRNARLDSVVFISDKKALMVTSNYCVNKRTKATTYWSAGRDTVYNHPLFSKKHKLDSIRSALRDQYYFENAVEEVKFVGYDNKHTTTQSFEPEISMGSENIPLSVNKRQVRMQNKVEVTDNPTEFYVWDSAEEDGDTVSLFLNGVCVLERFKLTKEKKAISAPLLANANNYLVLYAHNVGQKPPNTAAVLVYDRGKAKKLFLKADAKYCGAINFVYIPKRKRSGLVPPICNNPPGSHNDYQSPLLLLAAALFALICGSAYSRFNPQVR